MTSWTYWRRFYRRFNWDAAYKNRCDGMARWLKIPHAPPVLVAMNARMILETHYRGRWRTVWGVFKDACWSHYAERYAPAWEWIRTKILRRPRDPDIVLAERLDEERAAMDEVASQL